MIFHVLNSSNHAMVEPLATLGNLIGNYWGFPVWLGILMMWAQVCARRSMDGMAGKLRAQVRRLIVGFAVAWLCVGLLKVGFDFPRPLTVFGSQVQVIGEPEIRYSLPSGHSAYIALVSMILWPLCPLALRSLLPVLILWVGWSRIVSGAHFPADVLAGASIGMLGAWVAHRVIKPLPKTMPVKHLEKAAEQAK